MLKAVKAFFDQNLKEEEISDNKLNLAAAALLFEVSRSDYTVDQNERNKIRKLVEDHFQVEASDIERLIELAEKEANEATSLHGFTSLIVDHWAEADRINLAEMMWQVAYADGNLDDHEVHLMRKIQRLLYIPHKQFIAGKLRAKDE
jgi:uncharacterized tellurite resistance protein B-like protein